MPDVFISYSRDDQPTARLYAEGLMREGFSVWWDQSLQAGEDFDRVTEQALSDAKAVVVLWSKRSVDSRWVRAEATEAKANNRLVPVMIEACKRPILFELTHTAQLMDWKGDYEDSRWRSFVDGLRRMTGQAAGTRAAVDTLPRKATAESPRPARRLLFAAITVVIALGGIAAWYLTRPGPPATVLAQQPAATTVSSIAVLPFVNMSADPEQEYFSDGLSEELINKLAHIDGLSVTARTSAFAFKGKSQDLRTVGQTLGVAHILEGSVRKASGRIRVAVQLINAATGYNIWSETFDRTADDVFAVQDEIAAAVAGRLGPKLGAAPRPVDNGDTTNVEAYDHFLRGIAAFAKGAPADLGAAAEEYRRALAIDPDFGRASAELAVTLSNLGSSTFLDPAVDRERVAALGNAKRTAPDAPMTHVASMWLFADRKQWADGDAACANVLVASRDPRAQGVCAGYLTVTGRVRSALPYREQALRSDPLSLVVATTVHRHYALLNMSSQVQQEYARLSNLGGYRARADEAMLAFLTYNKAPTTEITAVLGRACPLLGATACAAWESIIQTPSSAAATLRKLLADIRTTAPLESISIALAAASLGDKQLAMDALELFASHAPSAAYQNLWYPSLAEARKDPRFKRIVRDLGFVDFWRKSDQWPDSCRARGPDDFECF